MKKWLLSVLILFSTVACANAQQWVSGNTISFAWDAPTGYDDGAPFPPGMLLQYRVYTAKLSGQTPGTPVLRATTSQLQTTITFTEHGSFYVGVEAFLSDNAGELERSETCWSNVAACCQGGTTFGGRWRVVVNPAGIRIITIPK